ncbi:uncharacterized protein LOC100277967 [Zea mays]|jgi:hypothetical protein|uniref:uncharacterized protein LOC100277967 n=1 Tax=Zea mays TaxID=4577 RepID=UPI000221AF6C|nr:uncharacterized protein LOC100277967 [Zea mays]|eukprot:XP_020403215.1 uncharacterized protein LOC100277967 isoform X1 [Zea mays]
MASTSVAVSWLLAQDGTRPCPYPNFLHAMEISSSSLQRRSFSPTAPGGLSPCALDLVRFLPWTRALQLAGAPCVAPGCFASCSPSPPQLVDLPRRRPLLLLVAEASPMAARRVGLRLAPAHLPLAAGPCHARRAPSALLCSPRFSLVSCSSPSPCSLVAVAAERFFPQHILYPGRRSSLSSSPWPELPCAVRPGSCPHARLLPCSDSVLRAAAFHLPAQLAAPNCPAPRAWLGRL